MIDAMKQALEYATPGTIVPVTPETVKILVDALRCLHTVNAGLLNQNTELDKKLAELEAEGLEQARIIGMGAERELRLMAQVDELERALGIAGKALRLSIECHRCGRYIADV